MIFNDSEILALYKDAQVLAQDSDDEYTVIITEIPEKYQVKNFAGDTMRKGIIYFQRNTDKVTTWCGYWMDWTEDHWLIPDEIYYALPIRARAFMECEEQLKHWVHEEFDTLLKDRGRA